MHIPDGFLDPSTSNSLLGVVLAVFAFACQHVRKAFFVKEKVGALTTSEGVELGGKMKYSITKYGREKVFKMASVAAFIFSAQMINFLVASGTSGHLLGGVLAAILLGPLEGFLVITGVLVIQSLLYADGGLFAIGVNIFNMGIVGAIGGFYMYKFFRKHIIKDYLASAFAASWISVILASIACSFELALSGTVGLKEVLFAMVGVHALIGIGEGMVTVAVLYLLRHKES